MNVTKNPESEKMKKSNKSFWRLWAKSLGEKASHCDKESDKIAVIRTIIFLTYLMTNIAIVANAIRHWNDVEYARPKVVCESK